MAGDCFLVSMNVVLSLEFENPVLVHGLPVYRGQAPVEGRYWHAWVEVETVPKGLRYRNWYAVDRSGGKQLFLPQGFYYNVGQIDEEHVFRYTRDEAKQQYDDHGHCGPWVDGWETMGH